MTRTMLRTPLLAIGLATLSLVLAGCTGDGDPDPTSSTTSSGTATPTDTATPTETVALPVLPDEAKVQDASGAGAFVRHWYDLVLYGYASGDSQPMRDASRSNCEECSEYVELIRDYTGDGASLSGPPFRLVSADSPPIQDDRVFVSIVLQDVAVRATGSNGVVTDITAEEPRRARAFVYWESGGWQMVGIGE